MNKYKKHIFIRENIRDKNHPTPSCGRRGGVEIKSEFKKQIRELGLAKNIRVNSAGRLGVCKHGASAVVYPNGIWYGSITTEDVKEIIQSDLLNDKVVKELEITNAK